MFIGWLTCISQVLLPHSLCRSATANAPANRQMPIASVVSGKFTKKTDNNSSKPDSQTNRLSKWLKNKLEERKQEKRNLKNIFRAMLLKFVNELQNKILTTYHIEVNFKTNEKKPSFYKLELLAELRDNIELGCLKTIIIGQIASKFVLINNHDREISTKAEKEQIQRNFELHYKRHVTMKFLLRHWKTNEYGKLCYVEDNTIEKNGKKDYRVNILKTGNMPLHMYEDLFVIEIDTTDFK